MNLSSENILSAVNQQGSPLFQMVKHDPSETTRRALLLKAYLIGASHDGTFNHRHKSFRFSQKSKDWLIILKYLLELLGHKSWLYREGKSRQVYALETTAEFLRIEKKMKFGSDDEKVAYVRGYFDSEGGIPHSIDDRFYIQLCQKNYSEILQLKEILESLKIYCGKIHNPSKNVDPNYWRIYILTKSHTDFMKKIGSWHPVKCKIFQERMKI